MTGFQDGRVPWDSVRIVEVEGQPVGPVKAPVALALVEFDQARLCYDAAQEWFRKAQAHYRQGVGLLEERKHASS